MRETSMEHDALAALSAEAERRRVAMGRLRYSYGDLVADTTPEDRAAIVAQYRRERHRVVDKLVRAHQISAKIVPKTKPRKGRYKGV